MLMYPPLADPPWKGANATNISLPLYACGNQRIDDVWQNKCQRQPAKEENK